MGIQNQVSFRYRPPITHGPPTLEGRHPSRPSGHRRRGLGRAQFHDAFKSTYAQR